jgi:hypothetical protein
MRIPRILLLSACLISTRMTLLAQYITVPANNEILFSDNGQIRSYDANHRILFRRDENKMEFREYGSIIFSPGSLTGIETAKMLMLPNGNIGIGTSNPMATLHVNASAQVTGDDAVIFDKSRTPSVAGNRFTFNNVGGTWGESMGPFWRGFHLAAPSTTVNGSPSFPRLVFFAEYNSYTDPTVRKWVIMAGNSPTTLHDIQFKSENVELLYLKRDGNVGIGTTDPQAKLAVNGDVFAKKVKVTLSGWPDYVFNATYRLRPLSEVEEFIKQYHHLPEVPSAEEIEKNGLDLGDNQATLLQKIEELTLYVIEQNKKQQQLEQGMEALKQENDKLKDRVNRLVAEKK